MNELVAEYFGTLVLILMGVGVTANNGLKKTYASGSGWVLVSFGWGLGVFLGVIIAGPYSGAHINPAVSVGLAFAGKFPWHKVPGYILAQLLGAMSGALLAWWHFIDHYKATKEPGSILGTFCTGPAIKHNLHNLVSEVIGTFVLIFVVLFISGAKVEGPSVEQVTVGLGSIGALPVALLVVAIGLSLGGTTGYAINPARDLGPRLVHALVPIPSKGDSNWSYAWIPVIGPLIGAFLAAGIYLIVL